MKVWAVTLDVSALKSTAFEAVRGFVFGTFEEWSNCSDYCDLTHTRSISSIIPGGCGLWMSPLKPRSRSSFEGRTHSVGFLLFFYYFSFRLSTFSSHNARHGASPAGSLVGNLLPRLMLRERGVPFSPVTFSKTEANKPYVNMVRSCPSFHRSGTCCTLA